MKGGRSCGASFRGSGKGDGVSLFFVLPNEWPSQPKIIGKVTLVTLMAIGLSMGQPLWAAANQGEVRVDAAERRRIIQAVITNLKDHYVDSVAARKVAEALLSHEKNGDYASVTSGRALADLLTRNIRDASQDRQL